MHFTLAVAGHTSVKLLGTALVPVHPALFVVYQTPETVMSRNDETLSLILAHYMYIHLMLSGAGLSLGKHLCPAPLRLCACKSFRGGAEEILQNYL